MKGYKGTLYGKHIDTIEDPNCPPGMIYMLNDKYMEFSSIDSRSRWQRIKDKVSSWLRLR